MLYVPMYEHMHLITLICSSQGGLYTKEHLPLVYSAVLSYQGCRRGKTKSTKQNTLKWLKQQGSSKLTNTSPFQHEVKERLIDFMLPTHSPASPSLSH